MLPPPPPNSAEYAPVAFVKCLKLLLNASVMRVTIVLSDSRPSNVKMLHSNSCLILSIVTNSIMPQLKVHQIQINSMQVFYDKQLCNQKHSVM